VLQRLYHVAALRLCLTWSVPRSPIVLQRLYNVAALCACLAPPSCYNAYTMLLRSACASLPIVLQRLYHVAALCACLAWSVPRSPIVLQRLYHVAALRLCLTPMVLYCHTMLMLHPLVLCLCTKTKKNHVASSCYNAYTMLLRSACASFGLCLALLVPRLVCASLCLCLAWSVPHPARASLGLCLTITQYWPVVAHSIKYLTKWDKVL